jgi:hypothetical protein
MDVPVCIEASPLWVAALCGFGFVEYHIPNPFTDELVLIHRRVNRKK